VFDPGNEREKKLLPTAGVVSDNALIWNDLSTTNKGFSFFTPQEAVQVRSKKLRGRLITQLFAGYK
jgi:hypothetical protein